MAYENYLTTSLTFNRSGITTPEYGRNVWSVKGATPTLIDTGNYLDVNGNRPFTRGFYANGGGLSTSEDLISHNRDFTVSCWYYIFDMINIGASYTHVIFALYTAGIRLGQGVGSSHMVFIYDCEAATSWNNVSKYSSIISYDENVSKYRWCNVTITYHYSTKTIRIYFNGILKRTIVAELRFNYNAPSYIGTCYEGESNTKGFSFTTGYITYFRTYNGICLSTSDVLDLRYTGNSNIVIYPKDFPKRNIFNIKFEIIKMIRNDLERTIMPKESDNIIKNRNIKAMVSG